MNRLAKILVFCVTASGGCAASSDEPWTPATSDGKADGNGGFILDGADIPSQFVNPAKQYGHERLLRTLEDLHVLDAAMVSTANKVDGLIDRDGDISVEELVRMEGQLSTLSPAEQAAVPKLWALLELPDNEGAFGPYDVTVHDQSVPLVSTAVAVPEPGHHVVTKSFGGIKLSFASDVSIEETRQWNSITWQTGLWVSSSEHGTLDITGGGEVLLYWAGAGWDHLYTDASTDLQTLTEGEEVMERYVGGVLQERHRFTAAKLDLYPRTIDMTPMIDDTITVAGAPLVKNVVAATGNSYGARAEFRYEPTARPVPADASTAAVTAVATPVSALAPGRYSVPLPGLPALTLDLYATGVVIANCARMVQTVSYDRWRTLVFNDRVNHYMYLFTPETNRLLVWKIEGDFSTTVANLNLTSAMRVP